jgi:diacylglycerol kinase family enzyme
LESAKPIYAHLDGEVITAATFDAHILPGALRVRQGAAVS